MLDYCLQAIYLHNQDQRYPKIDIWHIRLDLAYRSTLVSRWFNKNSGSWNRVTHLGLEPVSS